MKLRLSFIAFVLPLFGLGQDEGLRFDNHVYLDYIKSVKLHIDGLFLSNPIIDLNGGSRLVLSFDDLSGNDNDFTYTVVHCNQDWKPSDLNEMEYIDGFQEERINDFRYSFKTTVDYTNNILLLPNEDFRWTKSGNYLLKVYEDGDTKRLAITRRFMVTEPQVLVIPRLIRPTKANKLKTHQEIDFEVDQQDLDIRNPRLEVKATILQNGRWDNAVKGLIPLFVRGKSMVFDYQDKVIFPAGKEFRGLDLRSVYYRSENIHQIEEYEDRYEITLKRDKKRTNVPYVTYDDLNGNFIIETRDQNNNDLASNYAEVFFSLYSPAPYYDGEVYIYGAFTDWQLKEEFKMIYNNAVNAYVGKAFLKQGYYDYGYAYLPNGEKQIDLGEIEGNWFETANDYTILIYYRPFGERYDRIIGVTTFSSAP